MAEDFGFVPSQPFDWKGRYGRIPGDQSVFHLRRDGGRLWPVIEWHRHGEMGECTALDSPDARLMAQSIASAKRRLGGDGGGAFVINEFGQVIVPASDGKGRRLCVGKIIGTLLFHDPFKDHRVLDLSRTTGIKCGDEWCLPYVGCQYNLSARSEIYFYRIDGAGGKSEKPAAQDVNLIKALRKVRRTGAVRFIVNPFGLVLTRRPPVTGDWSLEERWDPVYVGRIDLRKWFKQE